MGILFQKRMRRKNHFVLFMFIISGICVYCMQTHAQNVTIGTATVTGGSSQVTVTGNFTNNGTFDGGSSTINIGGNWSNNSTFTPSTSTIVFNGTSAQTITKSSGETFTNLTENKSSNELQLLNDITVNGNLTITLGDLNLNGKTLTLGTNATLSETPGNTVKGSSGSITITKNINNPNNLNVGGLGAVITTSANLGNTTVIRGHTQQSGGGNNSILRYYNINPTNNSGLNATLIFNYDDSELNGITENDLVLFRSTNSGTDWILQGGMVNTTNNTITLSGIGSFSWWTAASYNLPLPVELTLFTARLHGNNVLLNWATATEVNNYRFEVERNVTLLNNKWVKIGFVDGHGTVNTQQSYSFIDQLSASDMLSKYISYRLKQIDRDGKYEYSSIVNVTPSSTPTTIRLYQNYPNPFGATSISGITTTKINYTLAYPASVTLVVNDMLGREVARLVNDATQDAGIHEVEFNANNIPAGIYLYRLKVGGFVETKTMVVVR